MSRDFMKAPKVIAQFVRLESFNKRLACFSSISWPLPRRLSLEVKSKSRV